MFDFDRFAAAFWATLTLPGDYGRVALDLPLPPSMTASPSPSAPSATSSQMIPARSPAVFIKLFAAKTDWPQPAAAGPEPAARDERHARLSPWTHRSRVRSISPFRGWFAGIEKRRPGGKNSSSYLDQVHLYHSLESDDNGSPVRQQAIHKGYADGSPLVSFKLRSYTNSSIAHPFRCNFGAFRGGDRTVRFRVSDTNSG